MVFDVEGAFNKSWHPALLEGLAQRGCPPGLFCQVASFLQDRKCVLVINGYSASKELTRGFPQGVIWSTSLWNIHDDRVLHHLDDIAEQLKVQGRIKEDEAEGLGESKPGAYADDNWNLQEGDPDDLGALVQCGGVRRCEEAKIAFSKDKLEVIGFMTAKERRVGGKDV